MGSFKETIFMRLSKHAQILQFGSPACLGRGSGPRCPQPDKTFLCSAIGRLSIRTSINHLKNIRWGAQSSRGGYRWRAVTRSQPLQRSPPAFLLLSITGASLKNKTRFSVFFQLMKIDLTPLETPGCVYICILITFM